MSTVIESQTDLMVYVVEDDDGMRKSIGQILGDNGIPHRLFQSPQTCIDQFKNEPGCFLFDLCLPDMTGLELARTFREHGIHLPFIMISGNSDIKTAVDAMKDGAIDFLEKPFNSEALISTVHKAFKKLESERDVSARLATLTQREREFLGSLVKGMSVKAISNEFDISPKTGHVHRRNIHQKMNVDCDAALVKLLHNFDV